MTWDLWILVEIVGWSKKLAGVCRIVLLSTSIHSWRWSDLIYKRPPNVQYPPLNKPMFRETQSASIGVLVLFLLKVAGGDEVECKVKMESIILRSCNLTTRGPVRTFSLWSIPRITLSPAVSVAESDLRRSSANKALGTGFGTFLVSLKYLQF